MTADLYEIKSAGLTDVAHVMRAIADSIDDGEYGEISMAAIVIESKNQKIDVFGAGGGVDSYRAIALFNLGLQKLYEIRK